jgi:hypothetical protein
MPGVISLVKLKRPTQCLMCQAPLPAPQPGGGRPRRYCSDRWAMRRKRRKSSRPIEVRYRRLVETGRARQGMREQAERLAKAAGAVAFNLGEEDAITAARRLGG